MEGRVPTAKTKMYIQQPNLQHMYTNSVYQKLNQKWGKPTNLYCTQVHTTAYNSAKTYKPLLHIIVYYSVKNLQTSIAIVKKN